jgi:hypothetical protein
MRKEKYRSIIILLWILSAAISTFFLLHPESVYANTIGTVIQVPITFSANENVTALDYTVSVTNGTLTGLNCGGVGFTTISSSASNCVLANLSGGANNGRVGTATVRATVVGTLSVNVSGSLSNAEGKNASGGRISGATYTITEGVPVPPVAETSSVSFDRYKLVDAAGSEIGGVEEIIEIGKSVVRIALLKGEWESPTIIRVPEDIDSGIHVDIADLRIVSQGDEILPRYSFVNGLVIEKLLPSAIFKVEISEGTEANTFGFFSSNTANKDTFLSPHEVDTESVSFIGGSIVKAVEVGLENGMFVFNKPVKITFQNMAQYIPGFRQVGYVSEIEVVCKENIDPNDMEVSECYFTEGDDLVIWTKHFTTFFLIDKTRGLEEDEGKGSDVGYLVNLFRNNPLILFIGIFIIVGTVVMVGGRVVKRKPKDIIFND